ncbi:RNA polymerase subunit sigma-28, partial [Priestia megaterium]
MRQTQPLTVQTRTPACKPEGSIRQSFQDSLVLD